MSNISQDYTRPHDNQGALINTNKEKLLAYKMKKNRDRLLETLQEEVLDLRNIVNELKAYIHK